MSLSRRLNDLCLSLERLGFSKEASLVKLSMPALVDSNLIDEPYGKINSMIGRTTNVYESRGSAEDLDKKMKHDQEDLDKKMKHGQIEAQFDVSDEIVAFVMKEKFDRFNSYFYRNILFCFAPGSSSDFEMITEKPFGFEKLTRDVDANEWRVSFISLIDGYRGKGYGAKIYYWLTNDFLKSDFAKIKKEDEASPSLISDSIQTPNSKAMWIKLFEKNMLDSERVDSGKIVAVDFETKQQYPIVLKDGDWVYLKADSFEPIWTDGMKSDGEKIILKYIS